MTTCPPACLSDARRAAGREARREQSHSSSELKNLFFSLGITNIKIFQKTLIINSEDL